ncbi:thioredoxin domain-containing protein [Patescibacteria group bacterium]|nr:thioredoxin domain-containing protein [Patescibacteria group bacterium]MBU1673064.1 thioredoxin domain-containing protein [Patescibacteria group bacterium]MBU1963670.1 thioredoxin domain-containing protein [Patescibacteria group bacterium]
MEENKSEKKQLFEGSNPRLVFVLGIVVGVGVFSLLSLAILVAMSGKDDGKEAEANSNTNAAAVNKAPAEAGLSADAITITEADYIYGNPDASVTFVEFSDFQCPFCSKFHPTMKTFAEANQDNIRWIFKHFPLKSHPQAQPAAVAVECAGAQGKFFEYNAGLFENQSSLSEEFYTQLAGDLGLNTVEFDICLSAGEHDNKISADYNMALEAGVTGTPNTIVFNKDGEVQMISGAVDEAYLQSVLDDLK